MSEREVERERDTDTVDDRVTEARQLSESLRDLRDRRRERIEQELAQDTTRSDNDAFTGWVEGYTPTPTSVDVDVAYVDDGTERVETFTLDRPRTADDYRVDNEFVRFVRHVGDGGPTDVEATLEREVPLSKDDGTVTLDLPPENATGKLGRRVRRAADSSDLLDWEATRRRTTTTLRATAAAAALGLATFGWQALLGAEAYPNAMLPIDAVFGLMLHLIIACAFAIAWLPFFGGDAEHDFNVVAGFTAVVSVVTAVAAGLGLVPLGDPSGAADAAAALSTLTSGAGVVLLLGAMYLVRADASRALNGGKKRLRRLRRRFQMWRGVEHVDD